MYKYLYDASLNYDTFYWKSNNFRNLFCIKLIVYNENFKSRLIQELVGILNISIEKASNLCNSKNSIIMTNVTKNDSVMIENRLNELGAIIKIEEINYEMDNVSIVLKSAGYNKISVIKEMNNTLRIGLSDCCKYAETNNSIIKTKLNYKEALEFIVRIKLLGGNAEII